LHRLVQITQMAAVSKLPVTSTRSWPSLCKKRVCLEGLIRNHLSDRRGIDLLDDGKGWTTLEIIRTSRFDTGSAECECRPVNDQRRLRAPQQPHEPQGHQCGVQLPDGNRVRVPLVDPALTRSPLRFRLYEAVVRGIVKYL
jgi:hypothetical protein